MVVLFIFFPHMLSVTESLSNAQQAFLSVLRRSGIIAALVNVFAALLCASL